MNRTATTDSVVGDLAESFLERRRRGERPTIQEYIDRHPDLAAEISEVFSALVTVDDAGSAETDIPSRIGDYRIVREIGRGGMGVVYEAFHERLNRPVALKILAPHLLASTAHRERFLREARAAAQLHHTNIVPVHEIGSCNGRDYFAMQLVRGQSLDCHLGAFQSDLSNKATPVAQDTSVENATFLATPPSDGPTAPTDWRVHASIGRQAADALAHAHAHGITHRDVKPSNLLLDETGNTWLTDFGLAKAHDTVDNLTAAGSLLGTLRYMAPEQLDGQFDARSDVYSLGLTLYELATLRPAFVAKTRGQLIEQIRTATPSPPRRVNPALPRDFETILLKAIANEPERRYQSAAELADDLNRLVNGFPISARNASQTERLILWARRNPIVAGLTTVVALLLVTISIGSVVIAYRQSALRSQAVTAAEKERLRRQDLKTALENMTSIALAEMTQTGPPTPQQRNFFQAALNQLESIIAEQPDDPSAAVDIANAVSRVAAIHERLGHTDLAKSNYARAAGLADALVASESSPVANVELAAKLHFTKARQLNALHDFAGARDAGTRSLQLWERAAEMPDHDRTMVYRQIETVVMVGNASLSAGDKSAARSFLERADALSGSMPAPQGAHQTVGSLVTLSNTTELAAALGDARREQSLRQKTLATADWVEQNAIEHPDARSNVSRVTQGAGLRAYKDRDWPAARKYLERAANHYRILLSYTPADPVTRHEYGWNHNIRGHIEYFNGNYNEAVILLTRACDILAPLVDEQPEHLKAHRDYAETLNFRGVTHQRLKQTDEARASWDQAADQFRKLAQKDPASVESTTGLGGLLVNRALMEQNLNTSGDWLQWMDQAIVELRRAVDHPRANNTSKRYLRNAHLTRANGLHELGRFEEAVADWDQGMALNDVAAEVAGLRIRRSQTLQKLGRLADALREVNEASNQNNLSNDDRLRAARVLSRLSKADNLDGANREECRRRAIDQLMYLHKAGFFRSAGPAKTLKESEDLAAVRDVSDVQAIMMAISK